MNPSLTAKSHGVVAPAFDGSAILPRIFDWTSIQAKLKLGAATIELEPSFFETELGARYVGQLKLLGLSPQGASARVEATENGFTAELSIRTAERAVADRWTVEVDGNGMVRDCVSEHWIAMWQFEAGTFSRFFDELLSGI
jgi:hypothetical protein